MVTTQVTDGRKDTEGRGPFALGVLTTLFFAWGFCTCLNDILVPLLKKTFELNYMQTMLIQFVFFGGYFLLSIPSTKLIERFGYKYTIIIGLGVMSAGCLLFVPAISLLSYPIFLTGLFVLAGGITLLQVAANPFVVVLGPEKTSSARLNLSQAFNSLATFVAPVVGGVFILAHTHAGTTAADVAQTLQQRQSDAQTLLVPYLAIAIFLFLLAEVVWMTRLPNVPTHPTTVEEAEDRLWRHKLLVMGVVAIFVYVGAEVAIGSFLISYITSAHVGDMTVAGAARYLSFYWGGAMVGRFVGAFAMRIMPPSKILADNCMAAAALVVISMVTSGHLAMWAVILVGVCNSIMFPTIFALSVRGLGALTGRGSGALVMAIGGGAVIPMIQAAVADNAGLTISFAIPAACYAYIWLFALRSFDAHPAPRQETKRAVAVTH